MKEEPCPTDPARFICSPCDSKTNHIRTNSLLTGGRNCATSCQQGFYERDGDCLPCSVFDRLSCGNGSVHVPCTRYNDAECASCVNMTMPLNHAVWSYSALRVGGPSAGCDWECEPDFEMTQLQKGLFQCSASAAWNVWDLFTL
jgi:hypothetical protein